MNITNIINIDTSNVTNIDITNISNIYISDVFNVTNFSKPRNIKRKNLQILILHELLISILLMLLISI